MKNIKDIRKALRDSAIDAQCRTTDSEKIRARVYALSAILMSVDLEMEYLKQRGEFPKIGFFDYGDGEEL